MVTALPYQGMTVHEVYAKLKKRYDEKIEYLRTKSETMSALKGYIELERYKLLSGQDSFTYANQDRLFQLRKKYMDLYEQLNDDKNQTYLLVEELENGIAYLENPRHPIHNIETLNGLDPFNKQQAEDELYEHSRWQLAKLRAYKNELHILYEQMQNRLKKIEHLIESLAHLMDHKNYHKDPLETIIQEASLRAPIYRSKRMMRKD